VRDGSSLPFQAASDSPSGVFVVQPADLLTVLAQLDVEDLQIVVDPNQSEYFLRNRIGLTLRFTFPASQLDLVRTLVVEP
jgi:hypothetical protein